VLQRIKAECTQEPAALVNCSMIQELATSWQHTSHKPTGLSTSVTTSSHQSLPASENPWDGRRTPTPGSSATTTPSAPTADPLQRPQQHSRTDNEFVDQKAQVNQELRWNAGRDSGPILVTSACRPGTRHGLRACPPDLDSFVAWMLLTRMTPSLSPIFWLRGQYVGGHGQYSQEHQQPLRRARSPEPHPRGSSARRLTSCSAQLLITDATPIGALCCA
jgi:hypothetical protein